MRVLPALTAHRCSTPCTHPHLPNNPAPAELKQATPCHPPASHLPPTCLTPATHLPPTCLTPQADNEQLHRKRATALLRAQQDPALLASPPWQAFLAAADLLEEFDAHLVNAGWQLFDQLHSPAQGAAAAGKGAGKAGSKGKALGKQVREGREGAAQQQVKQAAHLEPEWTAVLWYRGLHHRNANVSHSAAKPMLP